MASFWDKFGAKIEIADLLHIIVNLVSFGMIKKEGEKFVVDKDKVREQAPKLDRKDSDAIKVAKIYAGLFDGDRDRWLQQVMTKLGENQQVHITRNLACMDLEDAKKTIQDICRFPDHARRLNELDARNLCKRDENDYPIVKLEKLLGGIKFENVKQFENWLNDPSPNGFGAKVLPSLVGFRNSLGLTPQTIQGTTITPDSTKKGKGSWFSLERAANRFK